MMSTGKHRKVCEASKSREIDNGLVDMRIDAATTPYARAWLRLTGERSIVRVLNDCQSRRIVLNQYDESMCLI